ncbi:stage III sporulation protein AF [Peribacillus psychrosaccharolyticus]|uniref:Stage III sporulation protein AF n=1 Tax=Peribacillus psychrosaccharolyticus TaxID=1407 RepID=A0A974NLL6_PERPY|nr:stage III sporulation protein AF [Peribacillus psychrosaccharolyticus]MEC2056876.1 stage III sporulation protein AF [Peribacillus psychrosaccharolyticus]MED3746458.1 stage III sporulation protein AF [Peribacillus psychrosaccharolyticus]QQT00003.1 stage III sporulation protein AF [Peribacillus psychrosaccharolyticus]
MEFITGWVTNIILFVLLATVIDMLLPSSAMQKYAKMTIGLLLIAVILSPILELFNKDFEGLLTVVTKDFQNGEGNNLENLTEIKKKEIQAEQDAYILKKMAVLLKTGVEEELIDKYQMEIAEIDIKGEQKGQARTPKDLNLQKISLVLVDAKEKNEAVEAVAKVEINTKRQVDQSSEAERVKGFLADKWSVDEEIIEIAGKKGGNVVEK